MDAIKNFEENVIVYEIDKYDTPRETSPEESDEIMQNNAKILETIIQQKILDDYYPCPSCAKKGSNSGLTLLSEQPVQDDPSMYNYAVIVISEHGRYVGIGAIIRECKRCNKIEYWGDLEAYAQVMAGTLTQLTTMRTQIEESAQEVEIGDGNTLADMFGNDCILTNVEESTIDPNTVETTPIDTAE